MRPVDRQDRVGWAATTVLAQEHIVEIIRRVGRDELMDRVIEQLDEALAAVVPDDDLTPARDGFRRGEGDPGVLEWMPHREPGRAVTLKAVSYAPRNPVEFGLPTILGTVTRFDDITGRLTVLCDGVLLTAIRTGAASAVASRLLARAGSTVLGHIGAGAQSVTQVHALSRVLPIRQVLVHDIDPQRSASFAKRVAFTGLDVQVADLRTIEESADVICTATSVAPGAGPVLPGRWLKPDVHINALGSDLPGKTEVPVALLRGAALVCADHLGQALKEGECQQLDRSELGPELRQLCADRKLADGYRPGVTVFDSTGFALEDHIALDVLAQIAAEEEIGLRVSIEHLPGDCLDPYSLPTRPAVGNHTGTGPS